MKTKQNIRVFNYLFHIDRRFVLYIRLCSCIFLRDKQHEEILNTAGCARMVGLEQDLLSNKNEDNSSFSEQPLITIYSFDFSGVVSNSKGA